MAKARGRNSTGCPLPIRDGRWTRSARHAESRLERPTPLARSFRSGAPYNRGVLG